MLSLKAVVESAAAAVVIVAVAVFAAAVDKASAGKLFNNFLFVVMSIGQPIISSQTSKIAPISVL